MGPYIFVSIAGHLFFAPQDFSLVHGNTNPANLLGNYHGTGKMNHTFEWGVVITRVLSVLSIVPHHCARLTYFLHPKVRKIDAVLIMPQQITLTLRCACGAQDTFPTPSAQYHLIS